MIAFENMSMFRIFQFAYLIPIGVLFLVLSKEMCLKSPFDVNGLTGFSLPSVLRHCGISLGYLHLYVCNVDHNLALFIMTDSV